VVIAARAVYAVAKIGVDQFEIGQVLRELSENLNIKVINTRGCKYNYMM
jgi:transcription initiation factor TFIIIB Brf1 subunit/transcription initiation factor TFIIB